MIKNLTNIFNKHNLTIEHDLQISSITQDWLTISNYQQHTTITMESGFNIAIGSTVTLNNVCIATGSMSTDSKIRHDFVCELNRLFYSKLNGNV
jgi:hypothetical protein